MFSLSDNNQVDAIEALKCTSRNLDDMFNIDLALFRSNGRSEISY